MEFVTPIITPIVESLMVPVKKHLGFLFSSTNYVRTMHARLLEVNNTARGMEKKKEINDANKLVVPDHVPCWLAQVYTINEEAEGISTDGNGCLDIKKRYKAGKRSFDILNKIDDLYRQESNIKWTNEQIPLGLVSRSTTPSTYERLHDDDDTQNMFTSRQLIFKDVLKSLEPESNTQKIALCGMGGIGKTTMMEELKKVVEKRRLFQWVFKVVIGQTYDQFAIQQAIAQYMGGDLTEKTRDARADRLGKRFEEMSGQGTKKILIILDDVWKEFDLKDIGLTSPLPKGFKLLITSRDEKVCIKMDVDTTSIFRIVGLEETEANHLFLDIARFTHHGDGEIQKIGEDILRKCGGLPLAIKTIALTLRGEEKDVWRSVLVRLERHDLEDIDAILGDIFEISYNNLRKDDDKAIFILCGLFPDDFDVPVEELMRYGWGLQLFHKVYSLIEARQRTNTSVSNLIRANLLTSSNIKGCVKMHDLARDFILSNISKFHQFSIVNYANKSEWPTEDTRESCERILLKCTGMSKFPHDFRYPGLTLFKLMNGKKKLKFPDEFHKQMEKLKVIAYDEMQSPLHLPSLGFSISLQTLCLNSCWLVDIDISFLGDLINLEVLSLAHCGIRKLPSSIGKLKRLKLLDLTGCVDLSIDDDVFRNLEKLEELYMRVSKEKAIRFTHVNCDNLKTLSSKLYALEVEFFENILEPKNVSFEKLQRYRISIGCLFGEGNDDTNERYSFSNTLKFVGNCSELLECKISELFPQTEELHLSVKDMSYIEDILINPSEYSAFCNLKVLHVFKCADLTHLFTNCVANGLRKLESLTISSCHVLKSLVNLCDDADVIELPQLLYLKLYDLPNIKSIFFEENVTPLQSFLNKEVVIPKLSKLMVGCMENLKHIWPCNITGAEENKVSMLREIEVTDCSCLVNLFPRNPMRLLSHLEELKVVRCCSIETLFNINLSEPFSMNTSSLRTIKVEGLDELREVWKIDNENNSGHLIRGFQAVETVQVSDCNKFRNVFTPITTNFDMGALIETWITKDVVNKTQEAEITQEITEVEENVSIAAFPSYHLIHTFNRLCHIYYCGFEALQVVFEIELSQSINREPLCLFPYLEDLVLYKMDTLSHVWKWNELSILHKHQPQSSSFRNLTTINLWECNGIHYLFSHLMSKFLSSLKTLEIKNCKSMEEIVSNRDYDCNDDEISPTSTTTLFPCLDCLELWNLDNLKHIGGGVVKVKNNIIHDPLEDSQVCVSSWSLCQYSRKIDIRNCHALSSVIPSYAAGQMQKLQELIIDGCRSMIEVFETKEIYNNKNSTTSGSSSSKVNEGSEFQIPKHITTMHELPNLKILKISECDLLEYAFTFSTIGSLRKLENLSIVDCKAMKVIVREKSGEALSYKVVVVFPRLKSIELDNLPNLEGFFLGTHIGVELPLVDHVLINDCPQMMVFTSCQSTTPKLKYIHTRLGKHYLECGLNFHKLIPSTSLDNSRSCGSIAQGTPWSFHNLIEIHIDNHVKLKKIVPSNELPHLLNLEKVIDSRSDIEMVFEEAINNESTTVVKLSNLREVDMYYSSLRYIWKSNQWRTLEFPNLSRLCLDNCRILEYVFTTSMVGSLMKLQELHIRFNDDMEAIVKMEEECDREGSEVIFPCLTSLKLAYLCSLKGFCLGKENFTFPSLNNLVIKDCRNIMTFTGGRSLTPQLKIVETSFGFFHVADDINSFIITKKREGFSFGETEKNCVIM